MQVINRARPTAAIASGAAVPSGFPGSSNPARANATRYHGRRRLVQAASFALAILVPASGLLRIDPAAGALVVLDRQIWFSDFFLIAGVWIMLASALVLLYSAAGTVFCGWVCPQNILSEWANFMTRKLLGRRAKVAMDGSAPIVAATKDKALNWTLLGLSLLSGSLVVAVVPLFYFYAPRDRLVVRHLAVRPAARGLAALYLFCFRFDHPAGRCRDPPLLVPLRLCLPGLAAQLSHPRDSARALRCGPGG